MMKQKIRVIGFDDGFFKPRSKSKTSLVGVVQRLDGRIEGCLHSKINVDGFDSTKEIVSMLSNSRFKQQVKCIFLAGINFAGFNIIDLNLISKKLKLPVIIIMQKKPDFKKINNALKKLSLRLKRKKLIEKAGQVYRFKGIFFQIKGIEKKQAETLISKLQVNALIPEPLRLAHIIASAVTRGESSWR